MPRMEDGRIVRSRYTKLRLNEISSVDNPAQPGALASIVKRDDGEPQEGYVDLQLVAKYVMDGDGAHTFVEVLQENEFSQKIWPFTDALTQSIRSIVGDKRLSGDDREAKINQSVASFLTKVREISPEVAKQLEGLVNKKDGPMPKSIEELTADLEKANGQIQTLAARAEKAEGDLETAKSSLATAEQERDAAKAEGGELATVKAELATTKAALVTATEETLKVGDQEVRKSVVGETQFAVFKGLADERDLARLEKRAGDDYGHVVGKAEEKAKVLKALDSIADEDTRKAAYSILDSAEKMAKGAFDTFGGRGPTEVEDQATAKRDFDAKVDEIMKRDSCTKSEAIPKARKEHTELFKRMQGEPAQAAN